MSISVKDHYLPEFFISGFTDDNGIFWVYDKIENRIISKPQTKAMRFYEKKRNTITVESKETDIIEKLYQKIEDLVKNSIIDSRTEENLDKVENFKNVGLILIFIIYTYWRIPKNDTLNEKLLRFYQNNKKDWDSFLKLSFMNNISIDDRIKIAKTYIPVEIIKEAIKIKTNGEKQNYKIVDFKSPVFLISDNPVIFSKNPVEYVDFQKTLIFPICKSRIFALLENTNFTFDEESIKLINLLLIYQAERYVGFHDRKTLENIVESFNHFKNIEQEIINEIKKQLFERINH
jgi:hypothetical protein